MITQHSALNACLVFQSYLIANHLPKEDLLDVCLYCQHYCLLPLASEQRVGQLVVWREVFPQQRASGGSAAPGYSQPQGRHFLLIVGLVRRRIAHRRCAAVDVTSRTRDQYFVFLLMTLLLLTLETLHAVCAVRGRRLRFTGSGLSRT